MLNYWEKKIKKYNNFDKKNEIFNMEKVND